MDVRRTTVAALLVASALLSGCTALEGALCGTACRGASATRSTGLVQFLYPQGEVPQPATPVLPVPMRVGLAFLPSGPGQVGGLEPARREALLARIRERFASRPYVREIVIVPEQYLGSSGGITSIEQVSRLYGLDVVGLVGYDQVTYRDETKSSLAYLTIVGAYLVPGSRHEVHTLVDLAVVDPKTRSLVLRAGGTSRAADKTTWVDADRTVRRTQADEYDRAVDALIANLSTDLDRFEREVKAGTAPVRVATTGGGGAVGALELAALLGTLAFAAALRQRAARRAAGASGCSDSPAGDRS